MRLLIIFPHRKKGHFKFTFQHVYYLLMNMGVCREGTPFFNTPVSKSHFFAMNNFTYESGEYFLELDIFKSVNHLNGFITVSVFSI